MTGAQTLSAFWEFSDQCKIQFEGNRNTFKCADSEPYRGRIELPRKDKRAYSRNGWFICIIHQVKVLTLLTPSFLVHNVFESSLCCAKSWIVVVCPFTILLEEFLYVLISGLSNRGHQQDVTIHVIGVFPKWNWNFRESDKSLKHELEPI